MPTDEDPAELMMEFQLGRPLAVLDLSSFLYDLNRLYVATYRLAGEPYAERPAPIRGRFAYTLADKADRLVVHRIRFESPGLTECIGIAGVIINALTFIVVASSWRINREKILLDIEAQKRSLGKSKRFHRIEPTISIPSSIRPVLDRLRENELQPINVTIQIVIPPLRD
jgi:hypothetical protein